MNFDHHIVYSDLEYKIIKAEQEFIVHPMALGLIPLSKLSLQSSFESYFHVEDYRLYLDKIILTNDGSNSLNTENNDKHYELNNFKSLYSGAILIGAVIVKEYYMKNEDLACFSYQNVYELVFEDGILITTIDQSKAMLRIRKNIEMGLRSINNKRDYRCIRRFINSSFVGDYKRFSLTKSRMKYLQDMKTNYIDNVLQSVHCVNQKMEKTIQTDKINE